MFKMEPDINKLHVKQNTELCRAFRWDVHSLEQGGSNEGGQLLAKGQDMGPLSSKISDSDGVEIVYYGVSIPSDANVIESNGK
jgi:hypothetical protein